MFYALFAALVAIAVVLFQLVVEMDRTDTRARRNLRRMKRERYAFNPLPRWKP